MTGETPPAARGVTEAATALVQKLKLIHADPKFQSVWTLAHVRNGPYTGPQYDKELAALEAALSLPAPGETAEAKIREFAKAILHGDDEHRGWLLEAAEAFNAGDKLPAPRGKGLSVSSGGLAVKVKPIRWPAQCAKGKRVNADGAGWTYTIVHYGEPYIYRWAAEESTWSEPFETYEGAQTAVQAHFEARILSAIDRTTLPTAEGEKA